jgi:AcrR family transcriptional regulator
VSLADREGLDALTMRRLGTELGVEAMSLYKHVPSKDQLLDDLVDLVFGEVSAPAQMGPWKQAMREHAQSVRTVLRRHTWAIGLLEKRGARGAAALSYVDSTLGALRSGGFSLEDAAHAFWLLDSFVYGHVLQEVSLSMQEPSADEPAPGEFPHLAELAAHARAGNYSTDAEFDFGLELVLDALERTAGSSAGR